jgi:hypothetical protein
MSSAHRRNTHEVSGMYLGTTAVLCQHSSDDWRATAGLLLFVVRVAFVQMHQDYARVTRGPSLGDPCMMCRLLYGWHPASAGNWIN